MRRELIDSDFLNAYQVFYYFFRTEPNEMIKDRLLLEPATSLKSGIHIDDFDILEMIFRVKDSSPEILFSDGEMEIKSFFGENAYSDALIYIESYDFS